MTVENLTFERLVETERMMRALMAERPVLYYAASRFIPRGEILLAQADGFHPEYVACHTDDVEALTEGLKVERRLVPLAEWRPTEAELAEIGGAFAESVRRDFEARLDEAFFEGVRKARLELMRRGGDDGDRG